MDIDQIQKQLEALSAPLPGKDGFRLGLAGNPASLEMEYGMMLYGAVRDKRPGVVVELGTGAGYSTTWMLLAMEKNQVGRLWTVDVLHPVPAVWDEVGCPTARMMRVTGMVQDWTNLPDKIDMLFHDASHNPGEVIQDIERFTPLIPAGGVFMCHDIAHIPPLGDALAEWFDGRPDDWRYEANYAGCGMGIATRRYNPQASFIPQAKPKARRKKRGAYGADH